MGEKAFIQRSVLIWISVILASASVPFGMSLTGPENAKIMTGSSFGSIDEEVFTQRDIEERVNLERKEKEWREWIEEERVSSVAGNDDYGGRWIEGDLEKLEVMAETLREKEAGRKSEENKWETERNGRKIEETSSSKDLSDAKESLLPDMTDLVERTFNAEECEDKMRNGRELPDPSLKTLVDDYVDKVCKEGESHRTYLMEKIDTLDAIDDIDRFHNRFNDFFHEFESSAMTFEQFIRSEIRRMSQLIKEEFDRLERERYRIKNDLSGKGDLDCDQVVGMSVFGYRDGKYELIGSIANPADPDSIANDLGAGNKFSSSSIFNEFGRYGAKDGEYSAFNGLAEEPPVLIDKDNRLVGHLTLNGDKGRHIDPYKAYHCAKESFRNSISDHDGMTLYKWITD